MDTGSVQRHVVSPLPSPIGEREISPLGKRFRGGLLLLVFLLCSCSDYSVRQRLMLADSLSAQDADSSLCILEALEHSRPAWKESDRLYYRQILQNVKRKKYLEGNPTDTAEWELLKEQEELFRTAERRSDRFAATIVAVLLALLLASGMLILRFVMNAEKGKQPQPLPPSPFATTPEVLLMRKRCDARELPSEDEWTHFQTMIDDLADGFSQHLQSAYKLSQQELRVCLLIKTQFKPSEIAILTAHSKEAITSTRRRLYKKMTGTDGTPEMLDAWIQQA